MSELEISKTQVIQNPPNRKSNGNRYPLSRKLAIKALVDSGASPSEISKREGMNRATIYNIKNDPELVNLNSETVRHVKDGLTKLTYMRSFQSLKRIDDEKLEKSSALQLMTIAAIGIEKGRLMENLSTENVAHASVMNTIDSDVKALQERMHALMES